MKTHGILFKAEMIRALLNTRPDSWPAEPIDPSQPWKWQTRRMVDPQPFCPNATIVQNHATLKWKIVPRYLNHADGKSPLEFREVKPKYQPGDILYAKETFWIDDDWKPGGYISYRATEQVVLGPWKPSIFMPKAASRLWFEVKNVHCERVTAITESDANAEGIPSSMSCQTLTPAVEDYAQLWDKINGEGAFERSPHVWVYSLKRLSTPPDGCVR